MGLPKAWMVYPRVLPKSITAAVMQKKTMKDYFRKFDCNGDGKLNQRELAMAFRQLGAMAPGLRALLAILKADENGDGYISEDELDKLVDYAIERGYYFNISP
ncbi:probable calcium-binding protein CML28 [Punica granatum]|uniref:Probable calcium-binding protein CML28 n=1 Tax=Punica granatum TaxID=22663 RepID=A0A218X891_PUNGR|nr:probable calcium-binding protein CML28 [Punica granatum]OWM80731.1 hypothetical protein CDL15_Pgr006761 [Punica granatum]